MSLQLARDNRVDVSTDGSTWVKLGALNDFAPAENPTNQAADVYDTNGANSYEKTMYGWKAVAKFFRPTTAGVPSDPGQALIEATRFQFGTAARLYIRWYNKYGYTSGNFSGYALIDWQQSKTGVADVNEITATFTGDGALTPISNPYAAPAAPVIVSATPTAQSVGKILTINGSNFTGTVPTTGVTIGGVNASSWIVQSDSVITAVVPTGSAGSAPIIVTNASGASASFPYTRGA
jgi:hypothetical protein